MQETLLAVATVWRSLLALLPVYLWWILANNVGRLRDGVCKCFPTLLTYASRDGTGGRIHPLGEKKVF